MECKIYAFLCAKVLPIPIFCVYIPVPAQAAQANDKSHSSLRLDL